MKKKELNSLKDKTVTELKNKAGKKRLKLKSETVEFYAKGDNNPKKIRGLKKDIAQILTILRQKQIEEHGSQKSEEDKKGK